MKRFVRQTNTDCFLISGGWLLVSNVVIDGSSPFPLSFETSYHGISSCDNNNTFLTDSAMLELRTHLSFSQLRFHCSKQGGRTFHVATVTNSSGEAVVQYFSGQSDVQPYACGSFVTIDDDDSEMAKRCHEWGLENGVFKIGKWGSPYYGQGRLFDHPAFVTGLHHWILYQRLECDDYKVGVSSGDFWKVFVR